MSRQPASKGSTSARTKARVLRNARKKKHLILDLDDTLICSEPKVQVKGRVKNYPRVVERPGLDLFLEEMRSYYYLHLFTASHKEYADAILDGVGIRKHFSSILYRGHCKMINDCWVKDITSFPFPLSDMVLIDDSTIHHDHQPDNTILINPFYGDPTDNELAKLIPFLVALSKTDDVKPVKDKHKFFLENRFLPVPKKLERTPNGSDLEETERSLSMFFQKEEETKENSSLDESMSTEMSGFSAMIANIKQIRNARPKNKDYLGLLNEISCLQIEETPRDLICSFHDRKVSHNYCEEMEEKKSGSDHIQILQGLNPHSKYYMFF